MGAKQTKQSTTTSTNQLNETESNTLLRVKRQRKSTSINQLNRTSSSPVIAHKWRMSTLFNDLTNEQRPTSVNLTSSKSSMSVSTQPSPNQSKQIVAKQHGIIDLNKQMKENQQKLTNIIKQADSNQPSYHMNSKLYRPNSFLIANCNPVVPVS